MAKLIDNPFLRHEGHAQGIFVYTRQFPRYPTSFLVRLDEGELMQECRGNVCIGGFCVETTHELEAGRRFDLLFRIPGAGLWLRAKGMVLGCFMMGDHVGVRGRFVEVDPLNQEALTQWNEACQLGASGGADEIEVFSVEVSDPSPGCKPRSS